MYRKFQRNFSENFTRKIWAAGNRFQTIFLQLGDILIRGFEGHLCIWRTFMVFSKILKILHTEILNDNMSIQKVFRQCESFYGESKQIFVKKFFRILHMEKASPRCVFVNVSLKKKIIWICSNRIYCELQYRHRYWAQVDPTVLGTTYTYYKVLHSLENTFRAQGWEWTVSV